MKVKARFFVLAPVFLWPTVAAAYCPGGDPTWSGYQPDYYSVEKEFARSQIVLEAVLQKETWVGFDGAPASYTRSGEYIGTWYDLRITRSFKGKRPARVRLFSENSSARFDFGERKAYILFITEEKFDPPIGRAFTINNCGNSGQTGSRLIEQLRLLANRNPVKRTSPRAN